jgi:hypothetical protein
MLNLAVSDSMWTDILPGAGYQLTLGPSSDLQTFQTIGITGAMRRLDRRIAFRISPSGPSSKNPDLRRS